MNLKEMASLIGLEEDEFFEIVELFLDTAASDIKKIEIARSDNDCNKIAEAAHSLKGAAANLGFTDLSDLSAEVENNARNQRLDNLERAILLLAEKLVEIRAAL